MDKSALEHEYPYYFGPGELGCALVMSLIFGTTTVMACSAAIVNAGPFKGPLGIKLD